MASLVGGADSPARAVLGDDPKGKGRALTDSSSSDEDMEDDVDEEDAPRYIVPPRPLGAVELPSYVRNVDRAIRAFGDVRNFQTFLDANRNSVPLTLDPDNRFLTPIVSHNASTHNVVLKVTVPKRTGRKRKRGSNGPWEGGVEMREAPAENTPPEDQREQVCSQRRLDHPKTLLRKLQDNDDMYDVETVGVIQHTHRYRGLMDFQVDMSRSKFTNTFMDTALSGDVEKMKEFKLDPAIDTGPMADIIPPPKFTHMPLPYNYHYEQNPFVQPHTGPNGEEQTINTTAPPRLSKFLSGKSATPQAPFQLPDLLDPTTAQVITELEEVVISRPIWTRRGLLNHLSDPERLGPKLATWATLKRFVPYVFYQFRGGPFRDALIPFGLDPRTDAKYRIYQTMEFKLPTAKNGKERPWRTMRRSNARESYAQRLALESHIFDGETYHSDGKVWQVCDISDPLLKGMFDKARVRHEFDYEDSGWFHRGLWDKARGVMKYKLLAIMFNKPIPEGAFDGVFAVDEATPPPNTAAIVRLPDLGLTNEEKRLVKGRRIRGWGNKKNRAPGIAVHLYSRKGPHSSKAGGDGKDEQERTVDEELESLAGGSDSETPGSQSASQQSSIDVDQPAVVYGRDQEEGEQEEDDQEEIDDDVRTDGTDATEDDEEMEDDDEEGATDSEEDEEEEDDNVEAGDHPLC